MSSKIRDTAKAEPPITDRQVPIRDEMDETLGLDPCEAARIDERHRLGLAALAFSEVADGIIITDMKARILDVNPAFCRITGYSREEVIGRNPNMMKSNRHDATFFVSLWKSLHVHGRWQGEIWDRRKSGEVYLKWLSISAIRSSLGTVTHYAGIFTDITRVKESEEQIERVLHFDELTGLPNRILLRERLRQGLVRATNSEGILAVLFLDIDHFKRFNDDFGHAVGDELIEAVGKRIVAVLRESDTVARMSEDEFAVVLPEMDDAMGVAIVARKILEVFSKPIPIGDQVVSVTLSLGVSLFPYDAVGAEALLRNADTAMYHAKQSGRNTYRFYSTEMHSHAAQRVTLECDLRCAKGQDEFVLYYQPRLDVVTGEVCGVEALIRWNHPRLGLIPPARFIPVAEQTRLILPIGQWVLREACRQGRAWIEEGSGNLRVAVNLSAVQFDQQDLAEKIGEILVETGFPPHLLELELTESVAMRNPEATIETLLDLRAMGVRAAIDDFGTGYSSLSYLKRLPIDALKIDRSFVRDLVVDPDDASIAKAIIAMAHNLRLRVVAEGVETEEQMKFLVDNACDEIQGYFTGRPMLPARIGDVVRSSQTLLPSPRQGFEKSLKSSLRSSLRSSLISKEKKGEARSRQRKGIL